MEQFLIWIKMCLGNVRSFKLERRKPGEMSLSNKAWKSAMNKMSQSFECGMGALRRINKQSSHHAVRTNEHATQLGRVTVAELWARDTLMSWAESTALRACLCDSTQEEEDETLIPRPQILMYGLRQADSQTSKEWERHKTKIKGEGGGGGISDMASGASEEWAGNSPTDKKNRSAPKDQQNRAF